MQAPFSSYRQTQYASKRWHEQKLSNFTCCRGLLWSKSVFLKGKKRRCNTQANDDMSKTEYFQLLQRFVMESVKWKLNVFGWHLMLHQSAHLPGIAITLSRSAGIHGADGSVGRWSAIQVVCGVPGDCAEERTGSVIALSLIVYWFLYLGGRAEIGVRMSVCVSVCVCVCVCVWDTVIIW